MLRRFANSLVTRIALLGLGLIVLGLVGRMVILTAYLRDEITSLVAVHQSSIAESLARDVEARVAERLDLLRRLGTSLPPALLDQPEALRGWLGERHKLFPLFSHGLVVVPASGSGVIADYPELPDHALLNPADRDWFLGARDQGRATIGTPARGRSDDEPLVIMAVPLGAEGEPARAVLAGVTALAAPGFLDAVRKTRIGDTGGVLLISPHDKLFVASSDPRMILKPTPAPGVNLLHDRAMAGYRGTGITINAFGVEELSAIASVDSAGWFLVARMPTAEAFKALTRMRSFILQFGMVMTAVVTALLFLVLPHMLKPLRDSAREMRRMADGEVELHPLPVVREDEVGTLVTGFNYLLEQVRQRETALRERESLMTRKALHDQLTGLPNRTMFLQCLQQEITFTDIVGNAFVLMFLDLDGFKPVNDGYGHAAGDEILRQVANRLTEAVRPLDIVARLGGDEFVVLANADLGKLRTTAERVAGKCLETISLPFVVAGVEIRIGLSVGIAIYPDDGLEAAQLMRHADIALYRAKKNGRGCLAFFQDGLG
jgi:diguanylate cyclase (GGDEF)-like protein